MNLPNGMSDMMGIPGSWDCEVQAIAKMGPATSVVQGQCEYSEADGAV